MRILLFLIQSDLKNFNIKKLGIISFLMNVIFLILTVISAVGISVVLNYLIRAGKPAVAEEMITYIGYFIFFTPIMFLFIPSYKPKVFIFKKSDPVGFIKRTFIEIIYNFSSYIFLVLIINILILFCGAKQVTMFQGLYWLNYLFMSSVLCLIIQSFFSIDNKEKFVLCVFLLIAASVASCLHSFYHFPDIVIVFSTFSLVAAYYFTQYFDLNLEKNAASKFRSSYDLFPILVSVELKTNSVKVNLFISILFKSIWLFIFLKKPDSDKSIFIQLFQYLIISNTILFTYIYNNTWGYLKSTYKMLSQAKSIGLLFKSFISLLTLPLLIDFVITFLMIIILKSPATNTLTQYLLFYAITLGCNILIGFCSSAMKPFEVKKALDFDSFKSNTSPTYSFVTILSTMLIAFILLYRIIYIIPLIIFFLYFIYYRLIKTRRLERIKPNIYNIL